MRLLIELTAPTDFKYDREYYTRLQAFIYELLRGSEYDYLHNKKGYKFFTFSNIFPLDEDLIIKQGSHKKLIISSPDRNFIKVLWNRFRKLRKGGEYVKIGDMSFKISSINMFDLDIPKPPFSLYTATPVIVRIQKKYYHLFNIELDKPYIFWRREYGVRSFITMSKLNLMKKYSEFHQYPPETTELFQQLTLRKDGIVTYINIDGKRIPQVGSLWRFTYTYIDKPLKKILKFLIDTGIGERNSLGYGFLNLKKI